MLVVEEEVRVAAAYQRLLKRIVDIHIARDYLSAERIVGLYEYDAVVCDLEIPDFDYATFLDTLRRKSECPVLFTGRDIALETHVGYAEETVSRNQELVESCGFDVLLKPFSGSELREKAVALLDKRVGESTSR